ncbi:MAG: ATPase, T2SS/T4P/T4SS family [Clostridia bacterium]|nr:ATPase, T2SS/T4P/T4SS family [Clostridia bacterium]
MLGIDKRGIDEILLEEGRLKFDQLKQAWDIQKTKGGNIEDVLLELEFITKKDIMFVQAKKMSVDFFDLEEYEIKDSKVPAMITEAIAKRYGVVPVEINEGVISVVMKDPTDIFAVDDLRLATSYDIKPLFADIDEIDKLIRKYYTREPQVSRVSSVGTETTPIINSIYNASPSNTDIKDSSIQTSNAPQRPGLFKNRIGDLMVMSGVLTEEQLYSALEMQRTKGGFLGEVLVNEGYISKKTLYEVLEKQLGTPHIDLENTTIDEDVIKLVTESIATRYRLIPIEKVGNSLKVAMSDPLNIFSIDDLRLSTGLEIIPLLGDVEQIVPLLDKYYEKVKQVKKEEEKKEASLNFEEEIKKVNEEIAVEIKEENNVEEVIDINDVQNAPIVKMVNIIFNKAIASRASDIHIEPYEDCVLVRNRIDGQLVEVMKHDRKILSALVARIKIISGLNIAEKRVPQDGRVSLKIEGKDYDLRVSILPTMFGEKIVIRIIDKEGFNVSKEQLGFFQDDLEKFNEILAHPHGIVLVTGPTGSGKSTTLYTALKELCKPTVNILTVEDPVESTVRGINQVQVNVKAGLTFAAALRSFLRQDPDIIMVGEIRDAETAEIASRAAITGHLVLSTLHTNDAASSVTRLIDMGIEPFMVSSSIVGVIAQRLVRRLCPKCKEEYTPDFNEKSILNISDSETKIYRPAGCPACNNTGFKGRIAVYEIMNITNEHRQLISKNVTSDEIKALSLKHGMKTLKDNCTRLVISGVTSVDEMLRIAYSKE